jgi:regulator of protease activity HflC (stomatin/prohibitin superfamily)
MHRQVSAERSKRAEILESEGQRQSAINIAEGQKQATILASEAMRAENINKASGEAEAILLRAHATAQGLEMVSKAILKNGGEKAVSMGVAEKYVEAFGKLAKEGNTIVIPAGLGDIGGMIAQVSTILAAILTSLGSRHLWSSQWHEERGIDKDRESGERSINGQIQAGILRG